MNLPKRTPSRFSSGRTRFASSSALASTALLAIAAVPAAAQTVADEDEDPAVQTTETIERLR